MKTEIFLSGKYLKPDRSAVGVITIISIIGVVLGVAVLIVVLSVMTGFTELMKEKLLDTQAHLQIRYMYGRTIRRPNAVIKELEKHGGTGIPIVMEPVLMQIGRNLETTIGVMGVKKDDFAKRIDLNSVIKSGKFELNKGEIIIGDDLARRYRLRIGDKILLHSPRKLTDMVQLSEDGTVKLNENNPVYLPNEFTLAGTYSFNKSDFDRRMVFIDFDDAAELFGYRYGSATHIYGYVDDPYKIDGMIKAMKTDLEKEGFYVFSWKEMNANLLNVLEVEKRMMFFLLIFIVLVAAFSITNTLITSVYKKTREIGLLKALGASSAFCLRVFVYQGMLVGIIGSLIGTLLGILVVHFRNNILDFASKIAGHDLFPKEFYYFDGLPAKIVAGDVILIVVVSIILCTIGGLIPAIRAAKLDPAKALRYE
ncbi:MAG: ABC transporter permease [Lentisphaeria bacterium]|nr:ABC transporter permease [Lentisphaeria bacterium]